MCSERHWICWRDGNYGSCGSNGNCWSVLVMEVVIIIRQNNAALRIGFLITNFVGKNAMFNLNENDRIVMAELCTDTYGNDRSDRVDENRGILEGGKGIEIEVSGGTFVWGRVFLVRIIYFFCGLFGGVEEL